MEIIDQSRHLDADSRADIREIEGHPLRETLGTVGVLDPDTNGQVIEFLGALVGDTKVDDQPRGVFRAGNGRRTGRDDRVGSAEFGQMLFGRFTGSATDQRGAEDQQGKDSNRIQTAHGVPLRMRV